MMLWSRPVFVQIAAGTLCLLVGACACQSWSGPKTITTASGHVLCAKHHVALVTVRAYRARDDADIDMSVGWNRAAPCYPNRIPYRVSLRSGGHVFVHPITITYCPVC